MISRENADGRHRDYPSKREILVLRPTARQPLQDFGGGDPVTSDTRLPKTNLPVNGHTGEHGILN